MGCVGSKPPVVEDGPRSPRERTSSRRLSRVSSTREANPPVITRSDSSRVSLIDRKANGSLRLREDRAEKSRVKPEDALANFTGTGGITKIPKLREGEQIAAGWPSWLASAAGEAITGWIPRRADSFERLHKIGEGTYSSVYKARDLIHGKIVALKRVRFDNLDRESVKFMAREILILRRLDHPNIIKLEGLITATTSTSLYLIFEYMDHDLTGIASLPGLQFTEPQVEQLHKIFKLCGSPAEEYWENLKLPSSRAFKPQRPYRRRLAERFDISAPALALIETLLSVDPASRGTASSALDSEFFTTKPFACDPSTLPKYPPSKEIDARRRDEETRRRQALEDKRDTIDKGGQDEQEQDSVASLSAKVNAEFVSSLQKKKSHYQTKAQLELIRSRQYDSTSGPILHSSKNSQNVSKQFIDRQRGIYSGPLTRGSGSSLADRNLNDLPSFSRLPNTATVFNVAPSSTLMSEDSSRRHGFSQNKKATNASGRFPLANSDLDRIRHEDWLKYSGSQQFEEKTSIRRPVLHSNVSDNDKLHFSGPLLQPSKDLDLMLKEHDLRIQETARRARLDKFKHSKVLTR